MLVATLTAAAALIATASPASAQTYFPTSYAGSGDQCEAGNFIEGSASFRVDGDDWYLNDTCVDGDNVWVHYRVDFGADGTWGDLHKAHSSGSGLTILDRNYPEPFQVLYRACPSSSETSSLCGNWIWGVDNG